MSLLALLFTLFFVILFPWSPNSIKGEPTVKDYTTVHSIDANRTSKRPTKKNDNLSPPIHPNGGNSTELTILEAEDKVVFKNKSIIIKRATLKDNSTVSSDIHTRCLGMFAFSSCQTDNIQVKVFNIVEDQYSSKFCFSLASFFQSNYPCFEARSTSEGITFKSIQGNDINTASLIMPETTSVENCYMLNLRSNRIEACLKWTNITWSSNRFSGCLKVRLKYYVKPMQYIKVHCMNLRRHDLDRQVHLTNGTGINLTYVLGSFRGEPGILNQPPLFSGVLDLDEPQLKVNNIECLKKEINDKMPLVYSIPHGKQDIIHNLKSLTQTECESPPLVVASTTKIPEEKSSTKTLVGTDQIMSIGGGLPDLEPTTLRDYNPDYGSPGLKSKILENAQGITKTGQPNKSVLSNKNIEIKPIKLPSITWVPMDFGTKRPYLLTPTKPQSEATTIIPGKSNLERVSSFEKVTSSPPRSIPTRENFIGKHIPELFIPNESSSTQKGRNDIKLISDKISSIYDKIRQNPYPSLEITSVPPSLGSDTSEEFGKYPPSSLNPALRPSGSDGGMIIGGPSSPINIDRESYTPESVSTLEGMSSPAYIPERERLIANDISEENFHSPSPSTQKGLRTDANFAPTQLISSQLSSTTENIRGSLSLEILPEPPMSKSNGVETVIKHPPSLPSLDQLTSTPEEGMPFGKPPTPQIPDEPSNVPDIVSGFEEIKPTLHFPSNESETSRGELQNIEGRPSDETNQHEQQKKRRPCGCSKRRPLRKGHKKKSTSILITQGDPEEHSKVNNPLMHIVLNERKRRAHRKTRSGRKKSRKRIVVRHRKPQTKWRKGIDKTHRDGEFGGSRISTEDSYEDEDAVLESDCE